jgi:hypothetical protein
LPFAESVSLMFGRSLIRATVPSALRVVVMRMRPVA